jgi:hypothetical protein
MGLNQSFSEELKRPLQDKFDGTLASGAAGSVTLGGDLSVKRLTIAVCQLHTPDLALSFEASMEELARLPSVNKIEFSISSCNGL